MILTDHQQDQLLVSRFHLTPDEVDAGGKLRTFAREGLGIELHVGQVAFAGLVLARHSGNPNIAKFMTLMLASGNRAGKTTLVSILIIYSCIRKLNRPLPTDAIEAMRWAASEYHWYHFGIAQEVADLVYVDIVKILSGNHEGQKDGCPLADRFEGGIAQWEGKEYGDYHWIRFHAQAGGAEIHFRTTGEKSLGQLGKSMNGLSFDEAGIERNLDFLIKEVFDFRRLDTGGQLIMVSTPSEDLGYAFADNWAYGDPANKDRKPSWRSLRMSSRDNIGYGLNAEMFEILTADMDERQIKQNVEGIFLQSKAAYFNGESVEFTFYRGLPSHINVRPSGVYLMGIDPAKTQDSAWAIVLKLFPNDRDPMRPYLVGVRAEQRKGQKSTQVLQDLAIDLYKEYAGVMDFKGEPSRCYTAIDATGFGGKMFREAIEKDVPNLTNVEFGGTSQAKRKLLGNLRTMIDEGRLILPKTDIWQSVRRQLLGYKEQDRGIEQDAVMALVCAVHLLRVSPSGSSVGPYKFDLSH